MCHSSCSNLFSISTRSKLEMTRYFITYNPTEDESRLMSNWIRDLRAFVHNEICYGYGTTKADE